MKRHGIILIVLLIFTLGAFFYTLNGLEKSGKKFFKAKENLDKKIGSKVIFEGDTLRMVDYSLFDKTYTLSNGVTVYHKMVKFVEEENK